MAVASAGAAPALVAEEIRAAERELRRVLPAASPAIQALALQAIDQGQLLDPQWIAALSSPNLQKDPAGVAAYAAWTTWAERYLEVLRGLRDLAQSTRVAVVAAH